MLATAGRAGWLYIPLPTAAGAAGATAAATLPPPYLTPPPPKNLGVPVMLTLLGNATAEVLAGALDVEFTGAFVFIARELLFPPVLLAELFIALPLLPLLLYAELPMLFMELPDVAVLLYALFPLETVLFENSDVTFLFVRGLTSITGS